MNKRELLLVALGSGGKYSHTPVQVQKLLFLIDKNVGERIGGKGIREGIRRALGALGSGGIRVRP